MIVDVELFYYRSDVPGGEGTWYAEWAERGSLAATEDQDADLSALVKGIVADVLLSGPVSFNWDLESEGGDLSPEEMKKLVEASGVTLPRSA